MKIFGRKESRIDKLEGRVDEIEETLVLITRTQILEDELQALKDGRDSYHIPISDTTTPEDMANKIMDAIQRRKAINDFTKSL